MCAWKQPDSIQVVKRMKLHALKIKRSLCTPSIIPFLGFAHHFTCMRVAVCVCVSVVNVVVFVVVTVAVFFSVVVVARYFFPGVLHSGSSLSWLPTRRNMLFAMFNNSILQNVLLTNNIQFNLGALSLQCTARTNKQTSRAHKRCKQIEERAHRCSL